MSEEASKEEPWWRTALAFWPLGLAIAATSVFGWYTIRLAQEVTTVDGVTASRYLHFLDGRPNEMGDTLAGFVGSLTLIWIIASVLQQSMELRAQRREFSEMVRAQAAQVRALEAQGELFEDEKRRRDLDAVRRYIDALLESLHAQITAKDLSSIKVLFSSNPDENDHVKFADTWTLPSTRLYKGGLERDLREFADAMSYSMFSLRTYDERSEIIQMPEPELNFIKEILRISESLVQLKESCDSVDLERLNRLQVDQIYFDFRLALDILGEQDEVVT